MANTSRSKFDVDEAQETKMVEDVALSLIIELTVLIANLEDILKLVKLRIMKHLNQTNSRNPNPWETELRYDGPRHKHGDYNTKTKENITTTHVHDRITPGGIRIPRILEIPNI